MRKLTIIIAAVAMLAVACGGSSTDTATPTSSTTTAADNPTTTAQATVSGPSSSVASGWNATLIAEGTKPSLALDSAGQPAVAFLFESVPDGFVSYASAANGWAVDEIVEGYFYGPIGLDFDPDGNPNIAYHDHQSSQFDLELGDLTHASRTDSGWNTTAAGDGGHDGWDSTIRVGSDGVVRAAGIDPVQFGSADGVEYYELVGDEWIVESIGSGPIEYEWNVDLQVAPDGTVGITYFQTSEADLVYASRTPGGSWEIETVADTGDIGRFSSFAFDDNGYVHISHWNTTTSEVTYSTNSSGSWETAAVAELSAVEIGMEGARRITSLAFDADGSPVIAYSDTSGIWLARTSADGSWESEQVVTAGDNELGQLISLAIDDSGTPHLSFTEVTGHGPLTGQIIYVTAG